MKKTFPLALVALITSAGAAQAQTSSVTTFGVIDLAATYSDNGSASALRTLSQDGNASSRLGFKGVESLGGGLSAGFWLEGALGADTGCGGPTVGSSTCPAYVWQRRATVSLMSQLGEIRLGRDYTPTFWNFVDFHPFGYNGIGSAGATVSALGSGATTLVRANNTVGYFLPGGLGGLYGQAMVAAGEGTPGNKYVGARLGYKAGGLNVAGSYGKTYRDGAMSDAFTVLSVGAWYDFRVLTVMANHARFEYADRDQTHSLIGVKVPVGASGSLRAGYVRARGRLGPSGQLQSANHVAIGYVHDLSKRTALYATIASLDNQGSGATGSTFSVGSGSTAGFLGGETSRGAQFGMRHSF
ncbi:MAG: porin [Rhizobacter sp.]|nr:porin [Rhizobacter sp.]